MTPDAEVLVQALMDELAGEVVRWLGGGMLAGALFGVVGVLALGAVGSFGVPRRGGRLISALLALVFVGVTLLFGAWAGLLVGCERALARAEQDPTLRAELVVPVAGVLAWEGVVLLGAAPGVPVDVVRARVEAWRAAGAVPLVDLEASVAAWRSTGTSPASLRQMLDTLEALAAEGGQDVALPTDAEVAEMSRALTTFQVPEALDAAWAGRAAIAARDGDPASMSKAELGALLADAVLIPGARRFVRWTVVFGLILGLPLLAGGWAAPLGVAWLLRRPTRPPAATSLPG